MRKECRECRSTADADARTCEACGCVFAEVAPKTLHADGWKGSAIAIASGLLIAVIFYLLRG